MAEKFAAKIILNNLKEAHARLNGTMDGVTDEVAHFMPAGLANPIAGTFAHLIFSEDLFIHTFLKKTSPLVESTFKDKTGASEVHPMEWVDAYPKWLKEVKLDMKLFGEYAKAVHAASEEYLATLTDEDLEGDVDMSSFGMGSKKVHDFLSSIIIGHSDCITGEISVLKGIQGLKGYPY